VVGRVRSVGGRPKPLSAAGEKEFQTPNSGRDSYLPLETVKKNVKESSGMPRVNVKFSLRRKNAIVALCLRKR
jgi:hypothetical protein